MSGQNIYIIFRIPRLFEKFRVHFPPKILSLQQQQLSENTVKVNNAIDKRKKGLIFLCQIAKGKTCCTIFVYDLWLSLWWLVNKTVPFCSAITSQILGLGLRTRPSSSTASSVLCLDGKSRRRDADYILTVEFRTLYKSFVFVVCSGAKSQINNTYKSVSPPEEKSFANTEFMFTLTADLLGG